MKIGILTFVNTINYGASLQAFALQNVLTKYGHDAELIQYTNISIQEKENNSGLRSFSPRGILKTIVMGSKLKNKIRKFHDFEAENVKLSSAYNESNISDVQDIYDKIVVGSDQVWCMGITSADWHYYLDFVTDNSKKVSYAPSFGNEAFKDEYKQKAGELLNDFKELSVREKSGAELIKSLNDRDAKVVLDPTLLLNGEEWSKHTHFTPDLEHYILVYFPHNKKIVFDFVEKLKMQTKLPVVYLSISPRIQKGVRTIYDASPGEFLGWIKNADYVVTGSFHGTAFSINFGKNFYFEPQSKGSRIDSLVSLLGLTDRCIDNEASFMSEIDYTTACDKLDKYREDSLTWLKNAIGD